MTDECLCGSHNIFNLELESYILHDKCPQLTVYWLQLTTKNTHWNYVNVRLDLVTTWPGYDLTINHKKLRYRWGTARCVMSIKILPIATQQCRNYLYDKYWPNRWYEVGDLVAGNAWQTMCTQPWRDRVGSHCLRCHKQTDDGRVVYITCIPTTCCGEIF